MKKNLPALLLAAVTLPANAEFGSCTPPAVKADVITQSIGKHAAMREEELLDHQDTHKWKDPETTDKRPESITEYHTQTMKRIVALLRDGSLTEEKGTYYKQCHTIINRRGQQLNADGTLSDEDQLVLRDLLNQLNDKINLSLEQEEKGDERTPILNQTQHHLEEQIEFGIRNGRLSTGEASRLTRMLERLERLEERTKKNGLRATERERLFEEAAKLHQEISYKLQS